MFDLSDRPLVWIPITWKVLRPPERKAKDKGDEGVAVEVDVTIDVNIEILDREELTKLFGDDIGMEREEGEHRLGDDPEDGDTPALTRRQLETARFMRVVKGWRKFNNQGAPVPFSDENATKLLAVPGFISAFETSYLAACAGRADIRRKN